MPDAEKPRVAKAAPAGRFASLSKRQWQDIRRARKLGADGLGGGLRVHGVEIFFPRPQDDVIKTRATEGRNGQRGGARRDDSQHAASRPGSRRRTGATPTRNARQQRQHDRLLAFQQAVRHRLSCIFRAWAEATRAEEDRLDDLTEDVRHATEHARILRDKGATREMRTDAEAQRRAAEHRLAGAMVARRPDPGADYMDDERAPKRGHSSPAGGAAAAGPSTPTRTAGGSPSASGTPPQNQPKRPRQHARISALPPSIIDGEEQALREASETLAAKAGDGPPARRA
jgi:hypothetical protein